MCVVSLALPFSAVEVVAVAAATTVNVDIHLCKATEVMRKVLERPGARAPARPVARPAIRLRIAEPTNLSVLPFLH